MTSEASARTAQSHRLTTRGLIREYYRITKPRVVGLIVFTAIVGMFLATPSLPDLALLFIATLGIGLAAAAGAAVNHILDEDRDSLMKRTRNRPLPTGTLDTGPAMIFACTLAALSMLILVVGVNLLTAVLTFASLIGYAVIYTIFLKYATPQNIVIGGAAGAMPPVLGWTAVTGAISPDAIILFLIIFCWTPPHFWALALYRAQDYQNADIPMLPVTHGEKLTRLHVLLYTVLLTAVTVMPFASGMFGYLYLSATLVLNAIFLALTVRLYVNYSDELSRRVFKYSIQYLAALFTVMLLDHYLTPLFA